MITYSPAQTDMLMFVALQIDAVKEALADTLKEHHALRKQNQKLTSEKAEEVGWGGKKTLNKESGWPTQEQCSIWTSHSAVSTRQKRIPRHFWLLLLVSRPMSIIKNFEKWPSQYPFLPCEERKQEKLPNRTFQPLFLQVFCCSFSLTPSFSLILHHQLMPSPPPFSLSPSLLKILVCFLICNRLACWAERRRRSVGKQTVCGCQGVPPSARREERLRGQHQSAEGGHYAKVSQSSLSLKSLFSKIPHSKKGKPWRQKTAQQVVEKHLSIDISWSWKPVVDWANSLMCADLC